jgi:hypothetical protein
VRSLVDLVSSSEGRAFLEGRGAVLSVEDFLSNVSPPATDRLGDLIELGERPPVYSAHQLQCDYPHSVVAKLAALREAGRTGAVTPVGIWLDMDRIGSNKLSSSILWPEGGRTARLVPQRVKEMEPRFAPVEMERLEEVVAQLRAWIGRAGGDDAAERHRRLADALLSDEVATLADASMGITSVLLREQVGLEGPSVLVSELADRGALSPGLEAAVADLDGWVAVFNAAVDGLMAADVDPQVRHLDESYVPLRYSCPNDGARCTLRRRREGTDHFAGATCRSCGTPYRFHLGGETPSPAELLATGRWSTDVSLPAFLNDLVGGVVVGRSSALYGLVLNEVVAKVLGGRPVPMLIPENLASVLAEDAPGSLLHDYLTAA